MVTRYYRAPEVITSWQLYTECKRETKEKKKKKKTTKRRKEEKKKRRT